MLSWLSRQILEFSGLSLWAKTVRLAKYIGLLLTIGKLISSFTELHSQWQQTWTQLNALSLQSLDGASKALQLLGHFGWANKALIFGIALTVISKILDAKSSKSILKATRDDDFYAQFDDRIVKQLSGSGADAPFAKKFGHTAGWTDPRINQFILRRARSNEAMPYRLRSGRWLAYDRTDPSQKSNMGYLRRYVIAKSLANGQRIFNGKKVRLCSELDAAEIYLQKTDYFSSLMTDGVAFRAITSKTTPVTVYSDGTSAFLLKEGNESFRLRSLADTKSSNQLGVSTLALTSDGFIPLTYQTRSNAHSMGQIAPSGSGSFDWKDIRAVRSSNLLDLVRYAAARELLEESGTLGSMGMTTKQVASQCVLPYAFSRLIHRGGKPEFFCLAYLPLTMHDLLKKKVTRRELIYTEKSFAHDASCIDPKLDLRAELRRICDYYSTVTNLFPHQSDLPSYGLSYQVRHGLELLRQALEDDDTAPLLLGFLQPHFPGSGHVAAH